MKQSQNMKVESLLIRNDRKANPGFVNIKSLTTVQLDELIERQNKLLQNRSFLEKLPDGGKKILSFKAELEVELKRKQEEYDEACQLLSNLSLTDKNAEDIEWNKGDLSASDQQLDSDDDDDDEDEGREVVINPLKYIATHSGTAGGKKIKKNCFENKFSIKDSSVEKVFYVNKYCEKYGKSNKVNCEERFIPNRLRNGDKTLFITSAEKVKERLGSKWEVTQATPPAPIYKDAVMISLAESLKLQREQAEKLKEIEKKNATEKFLQNMTVKIEDKLPINNITEYRGCKSDIHENCSNEHSEETDEENGFRDSDNEDKD